MLEKAFFVIAASCGYLAWSRFCENAGIQEPLATGAAKLATFTSEKAKQAAEKFKKNMKQADEATGQLPAPTEN